MKIHHTTFMSVMMSLTGMFYGLEYLQDTVWLQYTQDTKHAQRSSQKSFSFSWIGALLFGKVCSQMIHCVHIAV